MLLGFSKQFVTYVLDGSKTHTIRGKRRIRPKVGEICHCYQGLRTKKCLLLGRFPLVRVEEIRIVKSRRAISVVIEGRRLTEDERQLLAYRDGFRQPGAKRPFEQMMDFWDAVHGLQKPFHGDIIHWMFGPGPGSS
jgi:hypothetical protein